jgi:hypothetical protein
MATTRRSSRWVGVSGAVREECWLHEGQEDCYWWEGQTVLLLRTYRKHQEFRVACQGRVHWANGLRMGSNNTPFTTKSCACALITFLAGIISLAVDYNSSVVGADCLLFTFVCCVVSTLTWKLNFCSCWNSGAKLIDRKNYLSVLVAFLRELIVVTGTVNFVMCWRLN